MKKFICVRGWKRNPTGDIIQEWEYNKLPDEVKGRNFREYLEQPVAVAEPVRPPEPPAPVIVPEVKPHKFRPFTVEDTDRKED